MQLVIDIGNSVCKAAVFEQNALLDKYSSKNFSDKFFTDILKKYTSIKTAIYSTVRDKNEELIKILNDKAIVTYFFDEKIKLPIEILYKSRETLGTDRIAAAAGAYELYKGNNILIIDLGTAITIDFVSTKGQYEGGIISPGLNIRFRALHKFTKKIPLLKPSEISGLMGKSTAEAITLGVQNGIVFEIEQYILRYSEKYNDLKTVITGGDADFFVKRLKNTIFADSNLVLKGLNNILLYNSKI